MLSEYHSQSLSSAVSIRSAVGPPFTLLLVGSKSEVELQHRVAIKLSLGVFWGI